jgi:hypothetical protein
MDIDKEEEQEGFLDDGLENEVEIDEAEFLATDDNSDTTTDTSDDEEF